MGVSVAPVARFGGLDLVSAPDESGCIDLLNVDFDARGAIRQRDGYDAFTASAAAADYHDLHSHYNLGTGTHFLLAARGASATVTSFADVASNVSNVYTYLCDNGTTSTVDAIDQSGNVDASQALGTAGEIWRWDGSTFTAPAGLAGNSAIFLAVQPTDNRLCWVDGFLQRVEFSNAGDPETFTTGDFVGLNPGDGENLLALVAWRDLLFAFKQSKFFVFYGNSVDATGGAVFNYRTVATGVGVWSSGAACAGPDGVYFADRTGIYRTAGGPPQKISTPVDPIFDFGFGSTSPSAFYQDSELNTSPGRALKWHNGCLYFMYAAGESSTRNRVLKWNPQLDAWTLWSVPMYNLTSFGVSGTSSSVRDLMFSYATGSNHIGRMSTSFTDDDGTDITSRYRTGFSDLGIPGRRKDIDGTRLWGTGTVAVAGSRDFGDLDSATSVTLGTAPGFDSGLHNKQKEGELISYEFSGVDGGAWTLHRYAHMVRNTLPPDES